MHCEIYSKLLASAVAISAIFAMVIMVYIVYKKNK